MDDKLIFPNTILLGVQKAATTSLQRWLAQHPDVCAPDVLKDYPYFYNDSIYQKGPDHISRIYRKDYHGESVILQGFVSYIFDEKSLQRIKRDCPGAKFLLVLRNPVERAISAYYFTRQRGLEERSLEQAFEDEDRILKEGNQQEKLELTYKLRGLYYQQIQVFLKYFDMDQLCILFFEEIKNRTNEQLKKVFNFLDIDPDFQPNLVVENKTKVPKNGKILGWIYRDTKVKKFLIENIVDKLFPVDLKIKIKWAIVDKLVQKDGPTIKKDIPEDLRKDLYSYYESDVEQLEQFLQVDLSSYKYNQGDDQPEKQTVLSND